MENALSDEFSWLAKWYATQCNGGWEHSYGVTIETLDNPGWTVSIDLSETTLEGRPFEAATFNLDASEEGGDVRWHHCCVRDQKFIGSGGTFDLSTMIRIFRDWAELKSPS